MPRKKAEETTEVVAEEKPKTVRRGRPKKVDVKSTEAPSTEEAAAKDLAAVPEKTTKRTSTKKAASATKKDVDEKSSASDEVEKKPTRRRVSKKTSSASVDDEEAAATDAPKVSSDSEDSSTSLKDLKEEKADVYEKVDTESKTEEVETSHEKKGESLEKEQDSDAQTRHAARKNSKQGKRNKRQQTQYEPSTSREDLEALTVSDLREKAAQLNIDASGMRKAEMIEKIYVNLAIAEGFMEVTGILDILPDGYGFLRMDGYLPSEHDVYVSLSTIRRNGLRKGDNVTGQTRPARSGEKFAAIQTVISVNGIPVDELCSRPKFSELTPVYPDERLLMEHGKDTITARVIDLVSPIGKGQRGLIVSPPKAGKTTILKDIAASIHANNPEVYLMCLLVDERPEEVTDMERSIHGEVISSTFDMPCENHIQVSELVIERAKRLVEQGRDVVILLDSITRLARAYNLGQPASGRVLSGGVDSTALYPPKRFLGAARNIENGGSLTILASALIDTGSKMDEVIFEEFKGTGNMELKLDRNLADRRIFPAIDPITSGTRKEEILLDPQEAPLIWAVRSVLANLGSTERAMSVLIKSLKQTGSNAEFIIRSAKKAQTHISGDNFEL